MKCFLCKKNNFEQIYELKTKKIHRCKNDGLYLSLERLKTVPYGDQYFSNVPNLSNQSYFFSKLRKIQKLTAKSKPAILDIGCGWGDFEDVLEKPHSAPSDGARRGREKIPYLGIDVNKEAIEICKKKGLNCKQLTLQQLVINYHQLFDAITLFQVIEHLKNPLSILFAAKKLLKPGGIILITTPNNDSPLRKVLSSRWSVYSEPSHYVFYNKITLLKTLKQAGFNNVSVKTDQMRYLSSNYILQRLFQMYFHWKLEIRNWKFVFPVPTDPFGDLQAIAFSEDV